MSDSRLALVTGATGQQGGAVARRLLESGFRVRGMARNTESEPSKHLRVMGAEMVRAEFADAESLTTVLKGVDVVFAMTTPFEEGVDAETAQGVALVDAAAAAGVDHFVFSSVASANKATGIPHFDSKYRVEERLVSSDLRWSDIDSEGEAVRWRAKHEKTGYEHTTPVTDEALAALEEARAMSAGTGDGPVLPAPTDASRCVGRSLPSFWWQRAQTLAALEPKRGRGWHSLRRKFASDLMDQPLKVLCELGGWKTAKTVLQCYQRADEGQLRQALADRRRVRA